MFNDSFRGAAFTRAVVAVAALAFSLAAFAPRSARDGVYTKEQAARGKAAYNEECARCHSESLTGGEASPALAGNEFLQKWNGRTVGDLFELTRKSMPLEDPGNLSRRQYADITAYILSANDFPAGAKDLGSAAEELNEVKIELKR